MREGEKESCEAIFLLLCELAHLFLVLLDVLQAHDEVHLINVEAAKVALRACAKMTELEPWKPRFVAGAVGPTNKTLSVSPSVENPAFRACTFDEIVASYREQVG